jgi:hypothetical protein
LSVFANTFTSTIQKAVPFEAADQAPAFDDRWTGCETMSGFEDTRQEVDIACRIQEYLRIAKYPMHGKLNI